MTPDHPAEAPDPSYPRFWGCPLCGKQNYLPGDTQPPWCSCCDRERSGGPHDGEPCPHRNEQAQPDLAAIRVSANTFRYNHGRAAGGLAELLITLCDAFAAQAERLTRAEDERDEYAKGVVTLNACADGKAHEALKALQESLGTFNADNPWLGVAASVALLRMDKERLQADLAAAQERATKYEDLYRRSLDMALDREWKRQRAEDDLDQARAEAAALRPVVAAAAAWVDEIRTWAEDVSETDQALLDAVDTYRAALAAPREQGGDDV